MGNDSEGRWWHKVFFEEIGSKFKLDGGEWLFDLTKLSQKFDKYTWILANIVNAKSWECFLDLDNFPLESSLTFACSNFLQKVSYNVCFFYLSFANSPFTYCFKPKTLSSE